MNQIRLLFKLDNETSFFFSASVILLSYKTIYIASQQLNNLLTDKKKSRDETYQTTFRFPVTPASCTNSIALKRNKNNSLLSIEMK